MTHTLFCTLFCIRNEFFYVRTKFLVCRPPFKIATYLGSVAFSSIDSVALIKMGEMVKSHKHNILCQIIFPHVLHPSSDISLYNGNLFHNTFHKTVFADQQLIKPRENEKDTLCSSCKSRYIHRFIISTSFCTLLSWFCKFWPSWHLLRKKSAGCQLTLIHGELPRLTLVLPASICPQCYPSVIPTSSYDHTAFPLIIIMMMTQDCGKGRKRIDRHVHFKWTKWAEIKLFFSYSWA